MTTTTTASPTAEVLAAMLTENTGRHMLDSGGAYGRNFERQAGMTVEDFMARPAIEVVTGKRYDSTLRRMTDEVVIDWVNIDVFHFLRERLDYDADLDAAFREFAEAPEREREPWFACLDEWLREVGACSPEGWRHDGDPIVVNTYNHESDLSQVIQYAGFRLPDSDDPDEVYVALAIHGGCDVRGGYTAPRMFRTYGPEGLYDVMDDSRYTAVLTEPEASPEALAQTVMFPEHPVPPGGRQVTIDYNQHHAERLDGDGWTIGDDHPLADIDFHFGETVIVPPSDGDTGFLIASGPAKGWTVHFHEWPVG